jgi:dihydropyrimidinase
MTESNATTLIRGGRVVTASSDSFADVYIENGKVSAVGASLDVPADRVIDAGGCYVMPGCVDPHTHIGGGIAAGIALGESFAAGTSAAAFGGTTSIVNFVVQPQGEQIDPLLDAWRERLVDDVPFTDVGFHLGVTDLTEPGVEQALARAVESGVTSFKLFMAYKGRMMVDDKVIFRTMLAAAENDALIMVHAENGQAIDVLVDRALDAGETDAIWHAITRPPGTEAEATHRAIELADVAGAALYVVHVTCREAIEPIAQAQAAGRRVLAETCTQYLFIDEDHLRGPGMEGNKYIFTPPPRTKADHEALWKALERGTLSVVSSDHVAYSFEPHKAQAGKTFAQIPNGAPGIEDRLMMIHHFGVNEGRISLSRMVDLLSTGPAKNFGMYPRKGSLDIGSDADVVIFDPTAKRTISAASHHMQTDYNLYEGTEVVGAPRTVLMRGNVVIEDGELAQERGRGEFLPRARVGGQLAYR